MKIPFVSFEPMHREVDAELKNALLSVYEAGWFIRGERVTQFEKEFAAYCGAKYCIGCGNGLDALFLILKAYGIGAGDEVIVPSPYWVSYPELIGLADGKAVFVESDEKSAYKFTSENLEKAVTTKTKAIILNTPNNPTGTIYNRDELIEIAEFAKKYDLIIVSDEMYEKLIYDGEKHVSIASVSQDAYERTIVINGLSKSYAMTGWRLGYCGASEKIAKLMTNIQSHMTSNVCSITQYAALEALNGPQDEITKMINEFEKRRNYMINRIESIDNLSIVKPKGAFYIMINIENCLGKEINGKILNDSMEFCASLLENEKLAVIPGKAFGLNNYIRVSYATSMEAIKEGLNRIESFIKKLN